MLTNRIPIVNINFYFLQFVIVQEPKPEISIGGGGVGGGGGGGGDAKGVKRRPKYPFLDMILKNKFYQTQVLLTCMY